ncbi:MAG: hypothetical protein M0C28_01445 [Candidatus Moduliflexus flocculans]|nr:hypothetical protein [Candidatus Moduliflexus flocculans]
MSNPPIRCKNEVDKERSHDGQNERHATRGGPGDRQPGFYPDRRGRTPAQKTAGAGPAPIDPQRVQDQDTMTWADYRPIPGTQLGRPVPQARSAGSSWPSSASTSRTSRSS